MKLKHLPRLSGQSFAVILLSLILPQITAADTLSLSAGAGIWNEQPEGTYNKTTDPNPVDVNKNLFWDTESQGYLFASLEHFVPIIPNAKVMYTKVDHSGSGNTNFTFDGITYNGDIFNTINIELIDLLLYYEVLDNVVSLDLGLNVRNMQVDYVLTEATAGKTTESTNETIPMIYALVGFSPLTDLIISGEVSYVTYDGSNISDFTAKIAYTTNFFIGLEAGYRSLKTDLDDFEGTDANLTFEGAFAGAYLKF